MIVLPDIHTILLDMDGVLVDDISMFSQQDRLIKDMKNHLNTLKSLLITFKNTHKLYNDILNTEDVTSNMVPWKVTSFICIELQS